jgi:hypothetical protein
LSTKAAAVPSAPEKIPCPLCGGAGELSRAEILDRLGVRDFARVAQLSAEEAIRLLQEKHKDDQQNVWLRFEAELAKRVADIREGHKDELHAAQSERDTLSRRVEDCLREVGELRERNQELEGELSKAARRGRLEEASFEEEARTWAGICLSEKLPKNGDFILAYRDPSGAPLEPRMLVDVKDKSLIQETDVAKLLRDAKQRSISVAILVARKEQQLRQVDKELRWACKDGVWILRTTRQLLSRDLEILKPILETMRTEGRDFLEKNAALAEEVRRTFVDIDAIERELGKAAKAIQSVSALVARYKERLGTLCEGASLKKPSQSARIFSEDVQGAGA